MDSTHAYVRQASEPGDLIPLLDVSLTAKRLAMAMTIWMFYDLLLASPDLHASFVSPRWSIGRILYLLNRLVSPLMMLIHTLSLTVTEPASWFCSITPWTMTLGNWLVVFCIGSALIARIHALWQERWVLVCVIAAFATIFCGNLICIAYFTSKSRGIPTPFPTPFTGCFWRPMRSLLWMGLVTTAIWETICVTLTLWKTWSAESKRENPILYLLFYDGVLYYVSAIAIKVFAIVTGLYMETFAFGRSNAILALTSMLCTQLYLRLRRVAHLTPPTCSSAKPNGAPEWQPPGSASCGDEAPDFGASEKPLPPIPVHVNTP